MRASFWIDYFFLIVFDRLRTDEQNVNVRSLNVLPFFDPANQRLSGFANSVVQRLGLL